MMTLFEAQVGMLNFAGPRGMELARRIFATIAWVRAACERDDLPTWLLDMVIERAQRDLLAGDFPLVEDPAAAASAASAASTVQAEDDDELKAVIVQAATTIAPPPIPLPEELLRTRPKPPPGRPNPLRKGGRRRLMGSKLYDVRQLASLNGWGLAVIIASWVALLVMMIVSHLTLK